MMSSKAHIPKDTSSRGGEGMVASSQLYNKRLGMATTSHNTIKSCEKQAM
jgi:hypothetical protein